MYDSVTITEIPPDAEAVAGYVDGRWPTAVELPHTHPHSKLLSIATSAEHDADCLDIENGDALPAQAPVWVKRQHMLGKPRPAVYCSLSIAWSVWLRLRFSRIRRRQVRIITAHYTDKPHRCSPLCHFGFWTKADATQYTDHALGRNLDASLCAPDFFGPVAKPLTKRQLRTKILRWHRNGVTWARIEATKAWRRFRALGGH